MKLSYIVAGACLLVIPLISIKSKISEDLVIERKGDIVNMKIIDKPGSCLGTKAKWFMKVEYLGKVYSKQISGGYCEEHEVGDIVPIKYLPKYERVLLPDELVMPQIISGLTLSLFGLIIIFLGIKKTH